MEWISVKDRYPDDGYADYLVFVQEKSEYWDDEYISDDEKHSKKRVDIYRYIEVRNYENRTSWGETVTHWMPLPEPPSLQE